MSFLPGDLCLSLLGGGRGEGSCWHLLCGAWDPAKHSTLHKSAPHGARLGNLALKNQQLANKPFGAASSGTAGHGLCHRIPSLDTTAWTTLGRLPSQRQPWPTSRFPVNPTGAEWFRQGPQRYSEPGRFSGTVNSSLRFTVTEKMVEQRLPQWLSGYRTCLQHRRLRINPWVGRSPGEGSGNPLQYSCLKKIHGQGSLGGYSPWGLKESDTTE